jgi:hypothetical protein
MTLKHEGQHTSLLKMMELCQTPTPKFDNHPSPTLLSPPPPPLAAAYTLVVYDDNFCPPFLPAISKDDVTSIVLNKQVFRPIPTRPIVRNEINNTQVTLEYSTSNKYCFDQFRLMMRSELISSFSS